MNPPTEDLERRLFQLETLYEIGRECARVGTVPDVLRVILSMVMGSFGAVRGITFAGDPAGRILAIHARGMGADEDAQTNALVRSYLLGESPEAWLSAAELEVCLPFQLDSSTLGAVALGSRLTGAPYSGEDRALLETIVTNASPYLRNVSLLHALRVAGEELQRNVQALAVANEVALGMASRPSAPRLYRFLLERVTNALGASQGALALVEGEGWTVAALHPVEENAPAEAHVLASVARSGAAALPTGEIDGNNGRAEGSEVVVPIRYGDELVAAIWLRRDPVTRPFEADDRSVLEFLANQAAVILENSRLFEGFLIQQQEQFRLRGMLEQYLSPAVADRIISGDTELLQEGERAEVSVLMVDIRGSTILINEVEPEEMVHFLDQYLERMVDVLFHYEGTVDAFAGDAVLGYFGAPARHEDDPLRAVRAAAAMHRDFSALMVEWNRTHDRPLPPGVGIGVGIATGEVVVGSIGSPSGKRLQHTIIGSAVNLAQRLSAKTPPGAIQLDETTWSAVQPSLAFTRPRRPRHLQAKGFPMLIPAYRLLPSDVPAES